MGAALAASLAAAGHEVGWASAGRSGASRQRAAESGAMPGMAERSWAAHRDAAVKGWRWVGETEEGARAFAELGQPPGFHQAAAEVFAGDEGS
jgi:hypothetical protein